MTLATALDDLAESYRNQGFNAALDVLAAEPLRVDLIRRTIAALAPACHPQSQMASDALADLDSIAERWHVAARARASVVLAGSADLCAVDKEACARFAEYVRSAGAHLDSWEGAERLRASAVRQLFHRLHRTVKFGVYDDGERYAIVDLGTRAATWEDAAADTAT